MPLASLAPAPIIQLVRQLWIIRRAEFKEHTPLSQIAIFGAENNPAAYLHQSISRISRRILKEIFGTTTTLHMLRHCFCSFLFLRWYALRYPDIGLNLRDRAHAIFQADLQQRLNQYFNCMPCEDGEIRPYDLVSMTKLSGHASPEVFFQYYVHSFSVVQAHAVKRIRSLVNISR